MERILIRSNVARMSHRRRCNIWATSVKLPILVILNRYNIITSHYVWSSVAPTSVNHRWNISDGRVRLAEIVRHRDVAGTLVRHQCDVGINQYFFHSIEKTFSKAILL